MAIQTTALSFQPADAADIPLIFQYNKDSIEQYETFKELFYETVFSWVKQKIEVHIREYRKIFYHGKHCGYYYFHPSDNKMELDDLYLFLPYRGQGIGSAVLKDCFSQTSKPVFLYVFSQNTRAVSLYQKNNFSACYICGIRYFRQTQLSFPQEEVIQ